VPFLLTRLRTRSNRLVKERRKCRSKLKTIAGRLLRDFTRKVDEETKLHYAEEIKLIAKILKQKRRDKNKVYSLHNPEVICIAKGKAHKKYEFGRKASVTMLRDSGVIVSAVSFKENIYDGDTLESALDQSRTMTAKTFKSVLVDKGYKGRKNVQGTEVIIPKKPSKNLSAYHRKKQRKRNGRRAAIEPVISHLKSDYRMARCFLKGARGAGLNLALAAAAWNLKKWIKELLYCLIFHLQQQKHPNKLNRPNSFNSPLRAF